MEEAGWRREGVGKVSCSKWIVGINHIATGLRQFLLRIIAGDATTLQT